MNALRSVRAETALRLSASVSARATRISERSWQASPVSVMWMHTRIGSDRIVPDEIGSESDQIGPGRGRARSLAAFGLPPPSDGRPPLLLSNRALNARNQRRRGTNTAVEAGLDRSIARSISAAFSRRNQSGIGVAAFRSAGRLFASTHRSLCTHKFVCASSADPPLLPLSSPSPLTAMATTAAVDKEIEHLVEFVKVLGQ